MTTHKSDFAAFIIGLLVLTGLGQIYADPPLGFDMGDNPFNPYSSYNPNTQTGNCLSNDPCQTWDFITNTLGVSHTGSGTCQFITPDVDGDGAAAYDPTAGNAGDWSNIDAGCIVLEDWDQDGTCDHRVYDGDRDQVMTDYEPSGFYHQYTVNGVWSQIVGAGLCTGWVGV